MNLYGVKEDQREVRYDWNGEVRNAYNISVIKCRLKLPHVINLKVA